jgi:ATP-binding cassette subfamily B protein
MGHDLKALLGLLGRHKGRYALGALCLCVSDGGQLAIGWLIGRAIDAVTSPGTTSADLARYGLGILLLAGVVVLARFGWRQMIFGASRMLERDLRQRLLEHLHGLSAGFYHQRKVGDLMAYATNDVPAVQLAAAGGMMAALDAVIQATGAAAMMALTVDARLAALTLLPLLVLMPATAFLGRQLHARYGDVQGAFGGLSDRVAETIAGIRVVKGFAREGHLADRFRADNQGYQAHYNRMLRYDAAFDPAIELLAGLAFTLGLAYGGWLVLSGGISLGQYVSFNTYLAMLVWPMLALGLVTNHVQRATASLARLERLFAERPQVADAPGALRLARAAGRLSLAGLTFAYGADRPPALSDVHLELPAGRTVGIVGRTGSGKSTLANLLVRVHDPPRGQVFLDGIDVRDLALADLRRAVAMVGQDAFLFSRSLAQNIAFDPSPRDRSAIVAAAVAADVDRDIRSFPQGYDTLCGERGVTLSGGQRQRLTLARALAKDAPVLVLDDCLSAVDTGTEGRILAALGDYTRGRTTVIIAHRVSAVRHADEILVLDHGRVVERGTHEALVALGGAYAALVRRQAADEAAGIDAVEEVDGLAGIAGTAAGPRAGEGPA